MDIRIGIVQSMKELDVELPDDADRFKVMKEVEKGPHGRRRKVLVARLIAKVAAWACPTAPIAYVELGTPASERVVGFGAPLNPRDQLPPASLAARRVLGLVPARPDRPTTARRRPNRASTSSP